MADATAKTALRLFRWYDRLIVAEGSDDARTLLREHYTPSEIRRAAVERITHSVELTTDDGETFQKYTPAEAAKACGRGLVPEV